MTILGPMFIFLSAIISVAIYVLPSMIANGREHPHQKFIIATNLLIGWTIVVWFGCLIWSSLPLKQRDK